MKRKSLINFVLGVAFWFLLASPISEKKNLSSKIKYNSLEEFFSSKDYEECVTESNKIKYLADSISHGEDYWQSFKETDSLRTGDCDDKSPRLCYALNDIYPGFYLACGTKDINISYKINHIWIKHRENKDYIIEPSFKLFSKLDTFQVVKIFHRDSLPSNEYYQTRVPKDFRKKKREFKRRTGIKLPLRN